MRDLEVLAHDPRREEARALPILNGWRREMVGNELLEILEGRATIRVESRSGKMHLEKSPAPAPKPQASPNPQAPVEAPAPPAEGGNLQAGIAGAE
jgi:hypothetical protein